MNNRPKSRPKATIKRSHFGLRALIGIRSSANRGYTLTEWMIGLFLGSLVIAALISQLLLSNHTLDRTSKRIAVALDTQFIVDLLRQTAMTAGYVPCKGRASFWWFDGRGDGEPVLPLVIDNTHHHLKALKMSTEIVEGELGHSSKGIHLLQNAVFKEGESVVVADCFHAEIAKAHAQLFQNELRLQAPLKTTFIPPLYAARLEEDDLVLDNGLYMQINRSPKTQLSNALTSLQMQSFSKGQKAFLQMDLKFSQAAPMTLLVHLRNMKPGWEDASR